MITFLICKPHINVQTLQKESSGEDIKSVKRFPTLPEDIGKQTAVRLIEEIVKVIKLY